MEWWQIFLLTAIVVIAGVIGEVYVRLSSQRGRLSEERQKARKTIIDEVKWEIINKVNVYRSVTFTQIEEIAGNRHISGRLRRRLTSILDLAKEYDDWRYESWLIVRTEVKRLAGDNEFTELNDSLSSLIGGDLDGVFSGYDGHYSEPIFQAVYEGNLTFELARDSILKRRWAQSKQVGDKVVTLKEVIEGAQFHKFVEELKQLHERKSFTMLRKARETLLEKAQLILKEVT